MTGLSTWLKVFALNPWAEASRQGREIRYKLLAEMAGMLVGNADPDAVLRLLVEGAPEDLGLDICISYCADEAERILRPTYAVGVAGELATRIEDLPYGEGLCGKVAVTRRRQVVSELIWSTLPEVQVVRASGFRAYAGFPLLADDGTGELLGVLVFGSRRVDRFTDDDVALLASVANHVAAVRDRNRVREALEERETQFRTLADSIPQLAWMSGPDGGDPWFNRRWYDYTGTVLDDMQGGGWSCLLHPDHAERVTASLSQAWKAEDPWEETFPLRRYDGEWRWFLSRALPVRDAGGRVTMWFGTHTDITATRIAREEAEAANQSKSRFLAAASHDLRQPLQSMMLMAALLEGQLESDAARRTLVHLQRGMDALKSLLDGLLDMSRLDAGNLTPDFRDVPLRELLDALGSTFAPVAEGKGLTWHMDVSDVTVRTDPNLMGRILRNLAENAVRYTDHGGVAVTCVPVAKDMVRVTVRDSGIGIPAEQMERIWDEFHQVGNTERDRNQGTGLGLAIVRRLAGVLGVPVEVESQPGQGAAFTISVPLSNPEAESVADMPVQMPFAHGTALIVDGDVMVLLALQSIFRLWGYDVQVAGTAAQAFERLESLGDSPLLVVADERLRDGEAGSALITRIREALGRPVPGILLGGDGGGDMEATARAMGLGHIHKPVTPRQLARQVEFCATCLASSSAEPAVSLACT